MPEKSITRNLILEAVVSCIEKYGIDKVTTRKIADEAGTNIASINYYFRSKDELVAEALSMTINHMSQDVFAAIDDPQQPFEKILADVLFYLLDGSRKFPGISRAHLYKAVVERDKESISAKSFVRLFERLVQHAVREYPGRDPEAIRLGVSQILSSLMLSILAPGFFPMPRAYRAGSTKSARLLADCYARQFKTMIQAGLCSDRPAA